MNSDILLLQKGKQGWLKGWGIKTPNNKIHYNCIQSPVCRTQRSRCWYVHCRRIYIQPVILPSIPMSCCSQAGVILLGLGPPYISTQKERINDDDHYKTLKVLLFSIPCSFLPTHSPRTLHCERAAFFSYPTFPHFAFRSNMNSNQNRQIISVTPLSLC